MSTASTTPDESRLPADQQQAAERAQLNRNEPQLDAEAGTPRYGDFGKPGETKDSTPRSGSNDNPDEFSDIRKPEDSIPREGTTNSGDPNPLHQTGYVAQNRDPQAVRYAQGDTAGQNQKEEDNTREAWAQDDERYAGGHAEASWQERNDQEHDTK